MTITIKFPPATEERLRAEAKATGKDIGTLVVEAVEARLSLSELSLRDLLTPVHQDRYKHGMTDAELGEFLEQSLEEARSAREAAPGSSS